MSSCFQFAIFQHNLSTVVEAEKKDRKKREGKNTPALSILFILDLANEMTF